MVLGGDFGTVNIHCRLVQDIICPVDGNIDSAEERRITSAQFKGRKKDKGAHQHHGAIGKFHRTVQVKTDRCNHDGNAGEFRDERLEV